MATRRLAGDGVSKVKAFQASVSGRGIPWPWGGMGFRVGLASLVVGAGTILGACGNGEGGGLTPVATSARATPTATPLPGKPYVVARGSLAATLEIRGRLAASRQALLFFEQSGFVKKLFMEGGDQVEEGQVLAEIEVSGLEDRIQDAQFDLERARLGLDRAKALGEEMAQLNLERIQLDQEIADLHIELETNRLSSLEWVVRKRMAELDTLIALRQLESKRYDVALAQKDVEIAQAVLDRRRKGLNGVKMVAPFSGVILSVEKRVGEGVSPFDPIGVLANVSDLQIEIQVLEQEIGRLSLEQQAEIVLDAFPETPFQAVITQVSGQSIIWQGQKAFKVLLALAPGQRVPSAIGMGADVTITTRKRTDTLLVPNGALLIDGATVYVDLFAEGVVRRQPVTPGISDATHTEVVAGLRDGDIVLLP